MPAAQMVDFTSFAAEEGTFQVGRMDVTEEISGLYRYELELFSKKADLKLEDLLAKMAKIGIKTPVATKDGKKGTKINYVFGMLSYLEQQEKQSDLVRYTACLVPRFWRLTHTTQSRIFQDKSVPEIIEAILTNGDTYNLAAGNDFEFKTSGKYAKRDYVVQYQETDFAFICRWLEHEGIFFSFEQKDDRDKLVFGDGTAAYGASNIQLPYRPQGAPSSEEKGASGDNPEEDVLRSWICRAHDGPAKVQLVDWNYKTPDVELRVEAEVRPGKTLQYEYGNHYKTQEQGTALAKVRAEAIKCRLKTFEGDSNCRGLKAGFTFEQKGHYRPDFDGKYLITSIRHRYTQGVATRAGGSSDATYENSFTAILASVVFRPERLTPWPKIHGTMNAIIDAEDESTLEPPIDEDGEYRLRMPFDMSNPNAGKGTKPVRMAQPATGPNYGMHHPLHYKTEVVVGHTDGDPDLPVILGSVPNGKSPSVVKGENKTQLIIKSHGENMLLFDDDSGKEMVFINAKKDMDQRSEANTRMFVGEEHHQIVTGNQFIQIKADRHDKVDGDVTTDVGTNFSLNVGSHFKVQLGDFSLKVKGKTAHDLGSEHYEKVGKFFLDAGDVVIKADSISIVSGGNSIVVNSSGVSIKGSNVTIAGDGGVKVNSGPGSSPKSGSAGSIQAPQAPEEPKEAGVDPIGDTDFKMGDAPAGGEMVALGSSESKESEGEEEEMEWISIELKDDEGASVPGERYQVKLPDQSVRTGYLNKEGKAKELVPKGGNCKVMFPDLHGDEWKSA